MPFIEIKNLAKEYHSDQVVAKVLHDLSFNIEPGEFVAIMGPSGSGKSTLMHILGFLDRPTTGQYFFKGEDTAEFDDKKLARLRNQTVGFVFQQFNLLRRTTVLENVKLPLTYSQGINRLEKERRAREAVAAVDLSQQLNNLSNQLSGGEQQRVAIARALVTNPEIIFADEPTGNLDSQAGEQVMQILNKLNQQGKTIILVTHEQYMAGYAERIIKLKDGHMVADEKVELRRTNGLVK